MLYFVYLKKKKNQQQHINPLCLHSSPQLLAVTPKPECRLMQNKGYRFASKANTGSEAHPASH
jgi:hypothetical protein